MVGYLLKKTGRTRAAGLQFFLSSTSGCASIVTPPVGRRPTVSLIDTSLNQKGRKSKIHKLGRQASSNIVLYELAARVQVKVLRHPLLQLSIQWGGSRLWSRLGRRRVGQRSFANFQECTRNDQACVCSCRWRIKLRQNSPTSSKFASFHHCREMNQPIIYLNPWIL